MEKKADILIVDDGGVERIFLSRILLKLGIEADIARSGQECLNKGKIKKYDIIFLDQKMVEESGSITLRKLRAAKDSPSCQSQVVFLGDDELTGDYTVSLKKPVEYNALYYLLKRLLPDDAKAALKEPGEVMKKTESGGKKRAEKNPVTQPENKADESSPIAWLKDVPVQLDLKEGIHHCGSEEGYLDVLKIFYSTIEQKADEIQSYYDERDIESYTIKVHALKSSAKLVGATELSDMALELEMAGKGGNIDLIEEKTDSLLENYRKYKKALSKLYGDDEPEEDKPAPPKGMIEDAYASILDFANLMDFSLTEMVVKSLDEYLLPKEHRERIGEINKKLMELDWEGIKEIISKMKK